MTIFELGYWQFAFWWTVMLIAAAWIWVAFADERRKLWWDKRLAWWLWHWFTGGDPDTDRSMPHEGDLGPYLVQRAALAIARTSCVAGAVACIYLADFPTFTLLELLAWSYGGALGLAAISYLIVVAAVRTALSEWWGKPLHDAIHGFCGWDEDMKWRRYLDFDRIHELGLALTVHCHPSVKMTDTNIDHIVDAVSKKLGKDIEHVPDWVGRASELVFRPPVLIPDRVPFFAKDPDEITNVRRLIETSGGSKVLLGLAKDGVPFWMDLDQDSPHFLISAGTGGGKSETLACIAAQTYWWGAQVYILDLKRLSHIWARDLDDVTIEADPEPIFDLFVQLAGVIDERTRACDHLRVGDPLPDFPRIVIVTEELNALFDELKQLWKGRKGESPAVVALRRILYMGRFLKIHVVAGAQRFDAIATGGGAARENYAWRCLAEHSPQAVDMLAKGAPVEPKTSEDRKGRAQVVNGTDVTEIRRTHMGFDPQDPYYHAPQLVAWLRSSPHRTAGMTAKSSLRLSAVADDHVPSSCSPQAPPSGFAVAPDVTPSVVEIDEESVLSRTDDGQGYVTLSEIVELGIIPRALKTVRVYSQRPWFPRPAAKGSGPYGDKYHEPAVREAWSKRPRIPENQEYYRPVVYGMLKGGRAVLEQALRGELPGVQAKVGYTWRDPSERAKEVQMGPADVVAVVDVVPVQGEELPDKAYHRKFWRDKVDKHRPKDEWFWVRPGGPVAQWLTEQLEATNV